MKIKKWFRFVLLWIIMNGVEVVYGAAQDSSKLLAHVGVAQKGAPNTCTHTLLDSEKKVKSNTHDICHNKEQVIVRKQKLQLYDLPPEMIMHIFDYLDGESLGRIAQADKESCARAKDISLYNFLHAAYNNNIEVVKKVSENCAAMSNALSVDSSAAKFGGKTAIMCAAQGGNVELMKYLLDCNAVVSQEDLHRNTILWYASSGDKTQEIFEFFLGRKDFTQNWEKYTHNLLLKAAETGHISLVNFLLEHEKEYGIDINKESDQGATALFLAAQNGHDKVVALLLKNENIDVNKAEKHGATPLFIAAQQGHEVVVELLVAHPNIDVLKARSNDITPIYISYRRGHTRIVDLLKNALRKYAYDGDGMREVDFLL